LGKKRTFFPAVGAFRPVRPRLSAYAEDVGRVPSDPFLSRRAVERRRLKNGGQKRSGATKGSSPSLAFKQEKTVKHVAVLSLRSGAADHAIGRRQTPLSTVLILQRPVAFGAGHLEA
jgi:hypothetical protein